MTTIERPRFEGTRRNVKPSSGMRVAPFALRDSTGDEPNDGFTLDGYGAVFNRETIIDSWEGVFREQIASGSMRKSFRENPPIVQFDHGRHAMIGSIPIAELKSIREESDPVLAPDGGAHIIARVFDNWLMLPVREAIAAQAVKGMSFRFEVVRDKWQTFDGKPIKDDELMGVLMGTWDYSVPDDELPLRTLLELKVPEMGPVVWPAYDSTSVGMRGIIDLGRLHDPEQRKMLARAVFIADSTETESRDDDADDDPAALAAALDAILDEATKLIADVDTATLPEPVAQACALLVGAETVVDELLEAMGVYDADDDDSGSESAAGAEEPRNTTNVGQTTSPPQLGPSQRTRKGRIDAPRSTDAFARAGSLAGAAYSRAMAAAGEHPSTQGEPQNTDTPSAVEHPSQPRGRRGIDVSLRTIRDMLQDIHTREERTDA